LPPGGPGREDLAILNGVIQPFMCNALRALFFPGLGRGQQPAPSRDRRPVLMEFKWIAFAMIRRIDRKLTSLSVAARRMPGSSQSIIGWSVSVPRWGLRAANFFPGPSSSSIRKLVFLLLFCPLCCRLPVPLLFSSVIGMRWRARLQSKEYLRPIMGDGGRPACVLFTASVVSGKRPTGLAANLPGRSDFVLGAVGLSSGNAGRPRLPMRPGALFFSVPEENPGRCLGKAEGPWFNECDGV